MSNTSRQNQAISSKKRAFTVLSCCVVSMFILFSAMAPSRGDCRSAGNSATEIDRGNLARSIQAFQAIGPRSSHTGQKSASHFIQKALRSFGLTPAVQQYLYGGTVWDNIIVTFPGNHHPNTNIIVVAHYDSKAMGPGADDNASGAAALLELARILRQKAPLASIQLAFFSNEERGRAGSKAYVRRARQTKKQILAVLNIDGVGYTPKPQEIMHEGAALLKSSLPVLKRGKIFVRLLTNFAAQPFRGQRIVKLVTREEDRHLVEGYSAKHGIWDKTAVLINHES